MKPSEILTREEPKSFTPGPWRAEQVDGWGGVFCITAGSDRPLFIAVKPKGYYTDYVKTGDGSVILSDERAAQAGNHVATPEIKAGLDAIEEANAHLIASAPDLYEALRDLIENPDKLSAHKDARAALAKATGEAK